MKFLGYSRVLCLSAHPDDAEYGMLGTILKYKDTMFHMVCLSNGGNYDDSTGKDRQAELDAVWNSAENIVGWDVGLDTAVEESGESTLINKLENLNTAFNNIDFDCIMITSDKDSHFEHRIVHNVGIALARKKKLGLIEYKTPSTLREWVPNLYVDVAEVLGRKMEILKSFESQLPSFYFDDMSLYSFHIDYQCQKRGMTAVESFNT